MKLASRLIVILSLAIGSIFLGVTTYVYVFIKERFERELAHEMRLVGDLFRANTFNRLRVVEEIVENTAIALSAIPTNQLRTALLQNVVAKNKGDIYGMALAKTTEVKAPYYYRDNTANVRHVNLAEHVYQYREKVWFQGVMASRKPQWSPAYEDTHGGDALMSTYSFPIFDPQGNILEILTGDLSLEWLTGDLNEASETNEHQYLFLTDHQTGTLLSAPDAFTKTSSTILSDILQGDKYDVLTIPIEETLWDVNVVFAHQKLQDKLNNVMYFILLLSVLGIALMLICIYFIGTAVAKPLRSFADSISQIGKGDINKKLPYSTRQDEIGTLSRAFKTMQHELNDYIASIKESEIQKQRFASEMAIGQKIQQALLPDLQVWKDDSRISIGGYLNPAKEVGGDLYDCFMTEPDKLYFFIGDVAGKGIPAALYMNGIRAYLRALAHQGKSPADIVGQINRELSVNNDLCMFATVVCGVLCRDTGALTVANAGHEQPFILRQGGYLAPLSTSIFPAVGIVDSVMYKAHESLLHSGDTLFLYTDGVLDALNPHNQPFGKDRLMALLADTQCLYPPTLVASVRKSLKNFTLTAEPFDDITVLAIQYKSI